LDYILNGQKPLEGRVGYEGIKKIKVGDYIYLNGQHKAQIVSVQKYPTFKVAVNEENYKLLIPDASSSDETVRVYEKIYPLRKQEKLGVYIFEIKYPA